MNYYDDYQFIDMMSAQEKAKMVFVTTSGYDAQYAGGAKGLLTGIRTYQLNEPNKYTVLTNYYDYRGRIVQTHATNHLGGFEDEYLAYNFTGTVKHRKHVHAAAGQPIQTEIYSYTYDHAERLLTVSHKLNDFQEKPLLVNSYDEIGRLRTQKKASETLSYTYNVRNWMTAITGNLFNETLTYNVDVDGLIPQTPTFNGNISAMKWKLSGVDNIYRGYQFSYDQNNRLTKALYGEGNNISINNKYNELLTYDATGNILTLQRNGKHDSGFGLIDNLTYTYNGNQLSKVTDAATAATTHYGAFQFVDGANVETEYVYDANGNLTQDYNRKISKIEYNSLNLPSKLQFSEGHMAEYGYDAVGKKLSVTYTTSKTNLMVPMGSIVPPQATNVAMTLKTDYCGNMIYENGKLRKILTDVGYITLNSGGEPPLYHYFLQDHLGNNRVVVQEDGKVEQVNHYYAFGGLMGESSGDEVQPYKYNGKEFDRMHGLDWYDYGARHYDAALARWMCMDPLTEKYYDVSPYAYCGNNPVNAIDPDGRKLALTSNITMSLATIQSTLPQSLRSYVRLQDGYIDLKFLEKGLSTMNGNISGNYQALYNIVSDSRTVEFSITDKPNAVNASGSPSTDLINFGPTEFFPDDNLGNKAEWVTQGGTGISLAPKSHQFTQWDKLNRNKLSNDQQQFSPNENYQIQINSSMFNNKATYKNGAIATTHELYGHILFMLMGWDSTHGTDRNTDNQKLEIWLKERANETNDNF